MAVETAVIKYQTRDSLFCDEEKFVFSTFLLRYNGSNEVHVWAFDEHLARLKHSASSQKMTLAPRSEIVDTILSSAVDLEDGYYSCRLVVFPDLSTITFTNIDFPAESSISLYPVECSRPLAEHKCHHMRLSHFANQKARKYNFDEALLIDQNGNITEGAWSNVFWMNEEQQLFTTSDKILPGITRMFVMQKFDVKEVTISLADLKSEAKHVFVSRSTTGLVPVHQVGEQKFATNDKFADNFNLFYESLGRTLL